MKSGDRRYTVEWITCGQPRPYADTIRHFIISVEWLPYVKPGETSDWEPNDLAESLIDKAAKALGSNFYIKDSKESNWASPILNSKTKLSPGRWEYRIEEAFTG